MKMHTKLIKKYLLMPFAILVAVLVLTSPLWLFLFIGHVLEKGDQRRHREYMLAMEVVKIGKKLDSYKDSHGGYPSKLVDANIQNKICATYTDNTICTKVVYKPNSDLTDFKVAAEVGITIAYAYPGLPIPAMAYNKNKLHQLKLRSPDDKLAIYLRNKKNIQEFKNISEWPTYEELAKR